jgi:hypothetical protein
MESVSKLLLVDESVSVAAMTDKRNQLFICFSFFLCFSFFFFFSSFAQFVFIFILLSLKYHHARETSTRMFFFVFF